MTYIVEILKQTGVSDVRTCFEHKEKSKETVTYMKKPDILY